MKDPVFCALPWVGLHNQANGDAYPCCYWSGEAVADLRRVSWTEAANAAPMRELRRSMLEGRPHPGCSSCYENERLGLSSLRQEANGRFGGPAIARGTSADGGLERPRLRQLHLVFSNVCNLRCRTCTPRRSTAWYQDVVALMGERYGGVPRQAVLRPAKGPAAFLESLEPFLNDVEEVRLTGGEPLLADEHYLLLERLLSRGRTDVRLVYNTNLSVLRHAGRDVPALWNRFHRVEVSVSFDASGRRGEYLRKGQSWASALANWKRARRLCPRVDLRLAPVASIFNVLHLPDFHRAWTRGGLVAPEAFGLHVLRAPSHYCVQALPAAFKRKVVEKYERYAARLGPAAAAGFRGVARFMLARDLPGQIGRWRKAVDDLDRVRGESCLRVFPELEELFEA